MQADYDDDAGDLESLSQDIQDEATLARRHETIENSVRQVLSSIGEDINREGLLNTPNRIARMYDELTSGYDVDPVKLLNSALFKADYDEMIVVQDIEFYSMCEHHLLPFFGKVHVAYIPNGQVIGLSKIPRVVEMYARRLQVQERMTRQIAEFIESVLKPVGVGVVVEGMHLCSMMRGVKKSEAYMTTSAMLGSFRSNSVTRSEFLNHLSRNFHG